MLFPDLVDMDCTAWVPRQMRLQLLALLGHLVGALSLEEEDHLIFDLIGPEALYSDLDPVGPPAELIEGAKGSPGCGCPTIKPRCMPSCDDRNSLCHCSTTDDFSSSWIDCCCKYTFINEYDFYYRYPKLEIILVTSNGLIFP